MATGAVGGLMRRALAAMAVATAVAALPQIAAGLLVWTFVVLPLTVTAGQGTVFTMTATNVAGPDDLGCMEVTLPSSFAIESVGDPTASNGDNWAAARNGSTIEIRSLSGGGRLNIGESVTFQVKATPSTAGTTSWPNHAHRQQDCSGPTEVGLPVQVVVLPALLPSPTPRPTATPTPKPNPTARPTPTPSLPVSLPPHPVSVPPLPSVFPTSTAAPTAVPSVREPSPSARESSSARPSSSPTPLPGGSVVTPTPAAGAGGGSSPVAAPRLARDPVRSALAPAR